jgi:hypothetical protein
MISGLKAFGRAKGTEETFRSQIHAIKQGPVRMNRTLLIVLLAGYSLK